MTFLSFHRIVLHTRSAWISPLFPGNGVVGHLYLIVGGVGRVLELVGFGSYHVGIVSHTSRHGLVLGHEVYVLLIGDWCALWRC